MVTLLEKASDGTILEIQADRIGDTTTWQVKYAALYDEMGENVGELVKAAAQSYETDLKSHPKAV